MAITRNIKIPVSDFSVKRKRPAWLNKKIAFEDIFDMQVFLKNLNLNTVCQSASCPNIGECFGNGTATFMILGDLCTRRCPFCDVAHGRPQAPDPEEPMHLARSIAILKLNYVVITSVDRDDLRDGGAQHFADCIQAIREQSPRTRIEILVPDFRGRLDAALEKLASGLPDVMNHNLETVPRLYPSARPGGDYRRSLVLLKKAKDKWLETQTKSSLMLGLGETDEEIRQVLIELRSAGCDRVAMGQYLRPDKNSLQVEEFVTPEKFKQWAAAARQLGFSWVMASPFTRSSYHAEEKASG